MKIQHRTSDDTQFIELISALDGELNEKYGTQQKQYNEFNKLDYNSNVMIALDNGSPVGCGCFKVIDSETVEVKRMFVKLAYRGTGVAKSILLALHQLAIEKGFKKSVLETGIKQPEAIAFYVKNGYSKIENYGQYVGHTNSVCMMKIL